jgi:hypothetical protein
VPLRGKGLERSESLEVSKKLTAKLLLFNGSGALERFQTGSSGMLNWGRTKSSLCKPVEL